jgi:adenine-specific DNA-methyltransferase
MLPTLWMKSGCNGECPLFTSNKNPEMLILPDNKFAVLIDENYFNDFKTELEKYPEIKTIFLITDYEQGFRRMAQRIPDKTTYQLYRDYLDNFRINVARSSR